MEVQVWRGSNIEYWLPPAKFGFNTISSPQKHQSIKRQYKKQICGIVVCCTVSELWSSWHSTHALDCSNLSSLVQVICTCSKCRQLSCIDYGCNIRLGSKSDQRVSQTKNKKHIQNPATTPPPHAQHPTTSTISPRRPPGVTGTPHYSNLWSPTAPIPHSLQPVELL